ncbi:MULTISPECIES: hypothetical protein [Bacillus cereus group]|uniref:Uncharacterized protein n=1 Tax=Bacillus cereus TaxID=1396 RepID=A0A9X6W2S2_BACCE|nr:MULTISPECIES: hypothetical protein [Bacillus cereus group]PFF51829.1 hypothetical protein CN357_03820 [Bacillus cereus]PGB10046.1 hypothetical protein COM09_23525 [Bacillus toyonensis]
MSNHLIEKKVQQLKKEVCKKSFSMMDIVCKGYDWCVFYEHIQVLIKRLFKTFQRLHKETIDFEIITDSDRNADKLGLFYYSKYGHVEVWYQINSNELTFNEIKTDFYKQVYALV